MRITGFVVGFGLLAGPALAAPLYSFQNFDIGPLNTVFSGINDAGAVSGYYGTGAKINFNAAMQGFVRSPSGAITLLSTQTTPFLPGQLNNAGQVAGTFTSYGSGPLNGAVYDPVTASFTAVAGGKSVLHGINNVGQITGFANDAIPRGFVENPTTGQYVVVGAVTTNVLAIEPNGINDNGVVVGQYQPVNNDSTDRTQGFVYDISSQSGTMLSPYANNPAGSRSASARGVNDAGVIVGCSLEPGLPAFFLDAGTYSFLADPAGTLGTCASSINASGVIAGYYTDAAGTHGFIATPGPASTVPEPAGIAILLLGIAGAGAARLGRTTSE